MMSETPDPLWDPALPGDEALQRLTSLLGAYRYAPPSDHAWSIRPARIPCGRRRRMMLTGAAALVACVAGLAVWMPWRLQWQDGRQWVIDTAAASLPAALDVGDTLTTDASQAAMVKVARIGRMEVTPGTQVKLLDTRAGHHRLELVSGRVRARIWAPPGYFAIAAGASETVDLGCEFEMDRDLHGNGTIHVTSGWIMHRVKGQETLVPAGSSLAFNAERGGIPLATTASISFRQAVEQLDSALTQGMRPPDFEQQVADQATSLDRFALLSLLTRYPVLASGPVYPKLAALLGEPIEAGHREAWSRGSVHAMNSWWERMPRPPKAWWLNWQDALG